MQQSVVSQLGYGSVKNKAYKPRKICKLPETEILAGFCFLFFFFFSPWKGVLAFCLWDLSGRTFGRASSLLLRNRGRTGKHPLADIVEQSIHGLIQWYKAWNRWQTQSLVELMLIRIFPQLGPKSGGHKWSCSDPSGHKCGWSMLRGSCIIWIEGFVLNPVVHFYLYGVYQLTQAGSHEENTLTIHVKCIFFSFFIFFLFVSVQIWRFSMS